MLTRTQTENTVIWYDDSLAPEPSRPIFDSEYWHKQSRITGKAQGRGTTWFIQLDGMQAALRHYRRGGLFGKLVKDHYWFTRWEQTRGAQEFKLLQHLISQGVNVPRPIAARAIKSGFTYTADLLSERIPDASDLVSLLSDSEQSAEIYQKIGQEIAKMHKAGVNHTDLNIHNILVDRHSQVWLIDFDKCGYSDKKHTLQSNLERLKRSFNKEKIRRNIKWQEADFAVLEQAYNRALR